MQKLLFIGATCAFAMALPRLSTADSCLISDPSATNRTFSAQVLSTARDVPMFDSGPSTCAVAACGDFESRLFTTDERSILNFISEPPGFLLFLR